MTQNKIWNLQLPECDGTYSFSGHLMLTRGIHAELSSPENSDIDHDVRTYVQQHHGADYLLVFRNLARQKIFCIDQLSNELKQDSGCPPEDDYWTILFSHEY